LIQAIDSLLQPGSYGEEAVSAIIRITSSNFRLLKRLLSQIARILVINERDFETKNVVDAARQILVIGLA